MLFFNTFVFIKFILGEPINPPTNKFLGLWYKSIGLPDWEVYPEGLTKIIENEVKRYSIDIPIHITENGMANKDFHISGKVDDQKRIDYYFLHLQEVKTLIEKGFNIKSYFAWSLLDNFEWSLGYSKRFGLVYVDFESQKRIKKKSWYAFAENLN